MESQPQNPEFRNKPIRKLSRMCDKSVEHKHSILGLMLALFEDHAQRTAPQLCY